MSENNNTTWQLQRDQSGIAWLTIDCTQAKVNTLAFADLKALKDIVDELDINLPKGLALLSGKKNGFIAGAEIKEFTLIEQEAQAIEHVSFAHGVFNKLASLPVPKVALIHGFCLGGGLELALCCDYLIADDDPSCKLGLPEVKLGIHPGYGGTVRLIERIGVPKAMDLMLSGRVLISRSAKKMGIVDKAVAKRYFIQAAQDYIQRAPKPSNADNVNRWLKLKPVRELLAKYLVKQVSVRANPDHYPAPYALINLWRQHGGDRDKMLQEEIKSISHLFTTPTSKNLVRIFFLQEKLKAAGRGNKTPKIEHIHVIGAGVMGGDIAAWSALRGLRVTLQDQNPDSIARALSRAQNLFNKKLKVPRLVKAAMDRLTPDLNGAGVANADLILEAIFENLEVKQQVFAEVESRAKPEAILASNTSSIPIEDIAQGLKKPSRLVGIHFFNPVAKMQLVEIVKGAQTKKKVIQSASAYTLQISRLPVGVKSKPGFLVNRVLMPYLIEAVTMLDEGEDAARIDKAATLFGMPMGPIELADVVGLDICLHVAENLLGSDAIPNSLKAKLEKGDLGKKTGKGYYLWSKGKPSKVTPEFDNKDHSERLATRMLYPMLNECIACLHEGVVASADELDAGVIFGTGFAPFKGGPIQMIRDTGADKITNRLTQLANKYGDRFNPKSGWEDEKNILGD